MIFALGLALLLSGAVAAVMASRHRRRSPVSESFAGWLLIGGLILLGIGIQKEMRVSFRTFTGL